MRLTVPAADPANGAGDIVPNVVRPKALQVWNSNLMAVDFDLDRGDPCEKSRPNK